MTQAKTKTVYEIVIDAVDSNDSRFHRHLNTSWLKEYVKQASDFEEKDDQDWEDLARCVREAVSVKKKTEIDAAMERVMDALNGSDKDLVIEAMARSHAFLFNELIAASMTATKHHFMNDGRVNATYKKLADDTVF